MKRAKQWLSEIFSKPVINENFRGDELLPSSPDADKSVADMVEDFEAQQRPHEVDNDRLNGHTTVPLQEKTGV